MSDEIWQSSAHRGDDVDIRNIRGQHQHQTGPRIPAIQAGAAQNHAGQRVGDVVHAVSSTLAGLRERNSDGTSKVRAFGTISTLAGARPEYSPSTCKWILLSVPPENKALRVRRMVTPCIF